MPLSLVAALLLAAQPSAPDGAGTAVTAFLGVFLGLAVVIGVV